MAAETRERSKAEAEILGSLLGGDVEVLLELFESDFVKLATCKEMNGLKSTNGLETKNG